MASSLQTAIAPTNPKMAVYLYQVRVKVYLFRRHAVQCIGSFCVALLRQVTIQLIISIIIIIVSSFAARVAGIKWLKERRSTFRVSQTAPWHSTCGDFHLLPQVSSPRNLAANVI